MAYLPVRPNHLFQLGILIMKLTLLVVVLGGINHLNKIEF